MLFVKLVNAVLCEISMYVEWAAAHDAYSACLRTAQGTTEDRDCYFQLISEIGEASLGYLSCLF